MLGLVLTLGLLSDPAAAGPIAVRVRPEPVYVEHVGGLIRLSCDFELTNSSDRPFEVTDIRAKAFSKSGELLAWNKVDGNGSRPSNEVLGSRRIEPAAALTVFDPFLFDTATDVARVVFEFRLRDPAGEETRVSTEVRPTEFRQKTRLLVPIPGARLWAYDGPGFLSHHRRVDLQNPFNRDVLGIRANDQRYAVDLVVVDRDGAPFHGDLLEQKNWVGLGRPVVAPASGVVAETEDSMPDDIPYDEARAKQNPMIFAGNYVVIDHGNGEVSALAHFRAGSIRVRKGQRVAAGEMIGEVGHSGMGSGLVHLHYELRTGTSWSDSEGFPAAFSKFRRAGATATVSGPIEAGWIIETPPPGK